MDQHSSPPGDGSPRVSSSVRLSYKFQRLRERLRAAIAGGELSGKLPGERELARRFHVNAKTLSKALTDLAAEGLLDRSIGRGTFVKGAASSPRSGVNGAERWLILADPEAQDSSLITHLRQINPAIQVVTDLSMLRPSVLNAVKAVIDLSSSTPDSLTRDLLVRNLMVVVVDREPRTYSVNAVLIDRALGASCLARDMMLSGHRRFLVVERRGESTVAEAIRRTAQRFAPGATVDSAFATDVPGAVEQQEATAVVCDSRQRAAEVLELLQQRQVAVPARVSLAAIGASEDAYPCSGYYVHPNQKAETIAQLVRDANLRRPTTLWLTGTYVDRNTIAPPPSLHMPAVEQAARAEPDLRFAAAPKA